MLKTLKIKFIDVFQGRLFIKSYEVYDCSEHLDEPLLIATFRSKTSKKRYKINHPIEGPCQSYKYKIYSVNQLNGYSEPAIVQIKGL